MFPANVWKQAQSPPPSAELVTQQRNVHQLFFLERGTKSLVVSDEERSLGLFSTVWVSLNKVIE